MALLAGGLPATAAKAQQRAGQRSTLGEVQRGVTVESRLRPDFDPLGVRLGAFRLDGFVESGLGYDSNVFGRRNNVKGDIYATETANVSVLSDWLRHAVGASATIDARQYLGRDELSWTDWNLGGFGRYDINAQTNVDVRYRHYREHLDIYNFDVQSAGLTAPVPFDSDEVQVSGNTRFNRLGLTATGLYRTYSFEDVSLGDAPARGSENSFNTAIGVLGSSYNISPGRFVTAVLQLQDITYTKDQVRSGPTDIIPRDRDSFTWRALAGFEYDFDGVWAGRIGFGWQQRNYRGAQLRTLEGPAFEGRLSWSPTQLTTVTVNVSRTLEESIRLDAVSYTRTSGGIRVDHEFLRNVILGAELRADRREYDRPSETATDGVAQLNGRWLINRSLSLVGSYAYNRRIEATGGALEYDRNLVQVRLRIAL